MNGQHCFKTWASTQAIIALSSGEAEYYGIVKAGSAALGCKAMFHDLGVSVGLRVHTDAEAAKGVANRIGLGKTRHIAVHFLWVQEKIRNGDFALRKVHGKANPADLMTKHLARDDMLKCMTSLCSYFVSGRAQVTPNI